MLNKEEHVENKSIKSISKFAYEKDVNALRIQNKILVDRNNILERQHKQLQYLFNCDDIELVISKLTIMKSEVEGGI